jgi:hypothetical protein
VKKKGDTEESRHSRKSDLKVSRAAGRAELLHRRIRATRRPYTSNLLHFTVASSRPRSAPGFNGDRAEAGARTRTRTPARAAECGDDASVPLCLHLLQIRLSGAHPIGGRCCRRPGREATMQRVPTYARCIVARTYYELASGSRAWKRRADVYITAR